MQLTKTFRLAQFGRFASAVLLAAVLLVACGCSSRWGAVNSGFASFASRSVAQQDFPRLDEFDEDVVEDERGTIGDAVVAELIAIFPGMLVPGLGHRYAGDDETGRKLWRIGELGYLMTAVGGGLVYAGYEAGRSDDFDSLDIPLYSTGGFIGGAGVLYLMTAWFYDMIDAPRAALSGGRPPARKSDFIEALDFFGD